MSTGSLGLALAGAAMGLQFNPVAGVYAGHGIHHGTGWLTVGAVSLAVAPALLAVSR